MKFLFALLVVGALAFGGAVALGVVPLPAALEQVKDEAIGASDSAAQGAGSPDTKNYIAAVNISYENGVERYHVRPSKSGRAAVGDELDTAWRQAVAMGVADRANLEDQFRCHPLSVIARAKSSWDLETWRPNVGLSRTMLAGCNPQ
ncbi:MAG: DUF2599 domain-containing protein, partial [Actinomycetia bacterium]|nr:DUF2599 domain-containing protein [Actinomycetes bacterium]